MLETKIKSIILKNFRNHDGIFLNLEKNCNIIGLIDVNGSGKTNILEAISLLSPGHGMRGASLKDMVQCNSNDSFLASFNISIGVDVSQKIDILYQNGKKKISINDKQLSSQGDLRNILGLIWLTPEIQIDISQNNSSRRKFFDYMICNFHSNHAQLINDYDALIKERIKILEMAKSITQNSWLDSIEKQISILSINIICNRIDFLKQIRKNATDMNLDVEFNMECDVLNLYMENGNIADTFIAKKLLDLRNQDKHSYRTNFGCHRYKFSIIYTKKNMNIETCSSGEKKYLITAFLISVAQSIIFHTKHCPIVLIDEFTSFVDENFRKILIDKLLALKCQIWLTGTEIPALNHDIKIYSIADILVK